MGLDSQFKLVNLTGFRYLPKARSLRVWFVVERKGFRATNFSFRNRVKDIVSRKKTQHCIGEGLTHFLSVNSIIIQGISRNAFFIIAKS